MVSGCTRRAPESRYLEGARPSEPRLRGCLLALQKRRVIEEPQTCPPPPALLCCCVSDRLSFCLESFHTVLGELCLTGRILLLRDQRLGPNLHQPLEGSAYWLTDPTSGHSRNPEQLRLDFSHPINRKSFSGYWKEIRSSFQPSFIHSLTQVFIEHILSARHWGFGNKLACIPRSGRTVSKLVNRSGPVMPRTPVENEAG